MKVRTDLIKKALSERHAEDFFLTEVKNGSTVLSNNLLKIDALAIKKSWSKPCITGYEVKVSRSDFMADEKWPGYLNYCHRFYFVCPSGLIAPPELPENVGLVWYTPEGGLVTRKKALFRPIEMNGDMLYYILLSRVDSEKHPFFSDKREFCEAWVKDKQSRHILGQQVGIAMVDKMNQLLREINDLKSDRAREKYEKAKEVLGKHQIDIERYGWADDLDSRLSNGMPVWVGASIMSIDHHLKKLKRIVGEEATDA